MTRMISAPVREIEDALAEEFRREGYPIHEHAGIRFIRIVHTTEHGEDIATEINLTQLAQAIERRLS